MARSFVPTLTWTDNAQHSAIVVGTIALAGSGNYVPGGVPIDFTTVAPSAEGPIWVEFKSQQIAGAQNVAQYQYAYVPSSNTAPNLSGGLVQIFSVPAFTPTGTISGNVIVKGGAIGEAIGINPDSNSGVVSKAAATDRTIPYATFLGGALTVTGGAVTAAGLAELAAASLPAGVTGDVIAFMAWFYYRNV